MLSGILNGAPIWVWPLLALLIGLGVLASRTRSTPTLPVYFLPLLGILSINSVNSLSPAPLIWGVFVIAYIIGIRFGFLFQNRQIVEKSNGRVTLKGEWVTLAVFMCIFWLNFVGGAVGAMSPDIYESTGFHLVFALIAGMIAGSFVGRGFSVLKAPST